MDLKFCELCEDFKHYHLVRYFYDKREVTSPTIECYVCWDCITNIILEKVQNKAAINREGQNPVNGSSINSKGES